MNYSNFEVPPEYKCFSVQNAMEPIIKKIRELERDKLRMDFLEEMAFINGVKFHPGHCGCETMRE